ncbi:MAG: methyltransferase [Solobacterium sp.]|nr:methyltransferase [Solobacterium sp.]
MRSDYLPHTPYTVLQPDDLYHFSSDSEHLGTFIRLKHTDSVLDIGCGTGVLMLYAAVQGPASITGIDLFEPVTKQAAENMEHNGVEAELLTGRVQDLKGRQFDVILCNPPFFAVTAPHLMSENEMIRAARHEVCLTLEELFASVRRLMKDKGRFYLVHRMSRLNEIMAAALDSRLHAVRIRPVYDGGVKNEGTLLMEFRSGTRGSVVFEMPLHEEE